MALEVYPFRSDKSKRPLCLQLLVRQFLIVGEEPSECANSWDAG